MANGNGGTPNGIGVKKIASSAGTASPKSYVWIAGLFMTAIISVLGTLQLTRAANAEHAAQDALVKSHMSSKVIHEGEYAKRDRINQVVDPKFDLILEKLENIERRLNKMEEE